MGITETEESDYKTVGPWRDITANGVDESNYREGMTRIEKLAVIRDHAWESAAYWASMAAVYEGEGRTNAGEWARWYVKCFEMSGAECIFRIERLNRGEEVPDDDIPPPPKPQDKNPFDNMEDTE